MDSGEENNHCKSHCLILPYPLVGHINPMLQFAKRLHHKGIQITLLLTKYMAKITLFSSDTFSLETFSDGFDDGIPPGMSPDESLARSREVAPIALREAVKRVVDSGRPIGCLVYDSIMTWALDVADEFGLSTAAFFTQSCAVDHIFHQVYKGDLEVPVSSGKEILIHGLPPLQPQDLPSFMYAHGSYPMIFELVVNQFRGLEKAKWLFFNTFYKLEEKVIDYMALSSPVRAIGPAVPSMYVDKRLPGDTEYGLSVYKPATSACMEWLNKQQPHSVTYVSFGSLAQLGQDQMEELAWGLRLSVKHFLWVVRSSEQSKLPTDFAAEMSEKGLIVTWGPQLDILAHEATCCFISHCGWNSTLEALSLGVPLVAMPQWTDQLTNSKYVTDVWKMGVRVLVGDNGLVSRDTIAACIREAIEGGRGEEIKKNAAKWKELAREATDEGGSSDKNIEEFVSTLAVGQGELNPNSTNSSFQ